MKRDLGAAAASRSAGEADTGVLSSSGPAQVDGAEKLYAGGDVNVYFKDNGSSVLVVTFTPRPKKGAAPPPLFSAKYLDRRRISYVAVQSLKPHWWQTTEMERALAEIDAILSNHKMVVTYGASMGAHGALMFSKRLGAKRVIASAPQYSIDPAVAPWETRWRDETGGIRIVFKEPLSGVCESADKVIIFDPNHPIDTRHAEEFGKVANTHYIAIPGCGHKTLQGLRQAGMLARFMDALLAETMQLEIARSIMAEAYRAIGQHASDDDEDD